MFPVTCQALQERTLQIDAFPLFLGALGSRPSTQVPGSQGPVPRVKSAQTSHLQILSTKPLTLMVEVPGACSPDHAPPRPPSSPAGHTWKGRNFGRRGLACGGCGAFGTACRPGWPENGLRGIRGQMMAAGGLGRCFPAVPTHTRRLNQRFGGGARRRPGGRRVSEGRGAWATGRRRSSSAPSAERRPPLHTAPSPLGAAIPPGGGHALEPLRQFGPLSIRSRVRVPFREKGGGNSSIFFFFLPFFPPGNKNRDAPRNPFASTFSGA